MSADPHELSPGPRPQHFATTQWSVVLAAGDLQCLEARDALGELCETYWYPLYAYVRRRVDSVHEAQDLTQAFFSHLLEKQVLAKADPDRGRFRAFLLTAFKNFITNQWLREGAAKRGGDRVAFPLDFGSGESRYQLEPVHEWTAEKLFERRWVLTLLDQVLNSLRSEFAQTGKSDHFDELKGTLAGETTAAEYETAAERLGITPAAAKQEAYRMRKRYRRLFREAVARTVASETEVDEEIDRLRAILEE